MQQKYNDVIDPKTRQHDELYNKSNTLQSDIAAGHAQIQLLENQIAQFQEERPDDYIYWKGRVMIIVRFVRDKSIALRRRAKTVFEEWQRRRTHPIY